MEGLPVFKDIKRPLGWKSEKDIQNKLERVLKTNMRLKNVVESVQKEKGLGFPRLNNCDRFTNMRPAPADATLGSSGGRVKILRVGTVVVRLEPVSPGGDVKLTLKMTSRMHPIFLLTLCSTTSLF